jgi:Protein of unknown function (DUF935)
MPDTIDQSLYPQILAAANEGYDEPIDRIESAQFDNDGNIIALAYSGDIPLAVKIDGEAVEVEEFEDSSQFSEHEPCDPIDPILTQLNPTARFSQPQQDTPDRIATNIQKLGDPIVGGWLRQIEQMLATSDDLEAAREALSQLYPDLDSTDLAEQMTDAMAAASMAGFWEAGSETGEEAEFAKIPEGTTRRRDGVSQVLKNSRWHNEESEESDVKKKNQST